MSKRVLVDTGPIYAIIDERDAQHAACVDELRRGDCTWITCWPVVTEAAWLLRRSPRGLDRLFACFTEGVFTLVQLDDDAMRWIASFMARYRDTPAQLADAALMYLAHREGIDTVFTLDRRDFSVYRFEDNRPVVMIPSPA